MKVAKTLTKLYPGTDCSHRDIIDLLQVVLYVILGHSVQNTKTNIGRKKVREKTRSYARYPASVFVWTRGGLNLCEAIME